jgi:hypothetical protein
VRKRTWAQQLDLVPDSKKRILIFFLLFLQIYKNIRLPIFCKTTPISPFQMMVGRGYRQKINFFMNSDKNKFYIKIVDFVEIYNFVVQI